MTTGPPAILVGGGAVAVSVARSLGSAGVPVHAIGDSSWDTVGYSRYCASFADAPAGDGVQQRYLDCLSRIPLSEAVIIPCSDDALEMMARNRPLLQQLGFQAIEADDDVVLAMLDKERTYSLAEAAGIEVPRRFVVDATDDVEARRKDAGIEFPCALKPLYSHLFARQFGTMKAFVVHDRTQLRQALSALPPRCSKMMLTEVIPGPDAAHASLYTYLDQRGEPLVTFTKRKLRQFPVGFGLGTFHVTAWDAEVARVGLQFCQGVGIRGMACVEFKCDQRDGRLKLIECNHRFTLGSESLRFAGVNLPLTAYNRVTGQPVAPTNGYREGVYLWSPLPDLRAFLSYRARGELSTGAWIRSLCHRPHFHLFDPADPGPSVAMHRMRAKRLVQRAIGRTLQTRQQRH